MQTDPPTDHLEMFTDKELYLLWQVRVKRLKDYKEKWAKEVFPSPKEQFLEESIDRVEKEMARRNLPIPGETTWKS